MRFPEEDRIVRPPTVNPKSEPETLSWESFWDVSDPETASIAMLEIYGAAAPMAASNCAAAALADGRNEDHRFWRQAQSCIEARQARRRQKAIAYWEANGMGLI